MIEGEINPIPLKGFTKINFLKNKFINLADKLNNYLKPTNELLNDPEYAKINTILTAYAAFFALAEKEKILNARASMTFDTHEIANGILNGYLDSYTCIGDGRVIIKGFKSVHWEKMVS